MLRLIPAVVLAVLAALTVAACGDDGRAARPLPPTTPATTEAPSASEPPGQVAAEPLPDPEPAPPARTRPTPRPKPKPQPKFTGVHAENYRTAHEVCGTFPPAKIASDLGVSSTNPADLARAYSEMKRPAFRQAPFEGCLDALLGRPPKVR